MTLKRQTVSGIKWLVGSSFLQKSISFLSTVILARILSPSVFGLYALAFVAIDTLGMFKSMGFDSALIRRKEDFGKAANTAFFVIPILGIILYLLLNFSAPTIGRFLNNKDLINVIRALGIIFIFVCFGKVPAALLEKNMRFKQITIIEISSIVLYSVTAIIFAMSGFGIWSLVIAYTLRSLTQNILFWAASKWRPKFEFDINVFFEMFHFGKFLFLGGLVWFLRMNLDNLLVGKLLGTTALGLYAIAFNIANFTSDYMGTKIYRVVFPAYSKLQDNLSDLRSATLKTLKYISVIAIPFGVMLFLLSGDILRLIYGPKWLGAINSLKILAIAGIFNTLPAGLGAIFLACGRPKLGLKITLLQVAFFFIFISPMAKLWGIEGVSIVVSLSSVIAFVVTLIFTTKLLSIRLKQLYLSMKPSFLSTLLMAGVIIFLKQIISQYNIAFFQPFSSILLIVCSIAIFTLSLFKFERLLVNEMIKLVF